MVEMATASVDASMDTHRPQYYQVPLACRLNSYSMMRTHHCRFSGQSSLGALVFMVEMTATASVEASMYTNRP